MSQKLIEVYGNGLFGTDDAAVNDRQLSGLKASDFGSVVLFALHVHENGDLTYNDTPIVRSGTFQADLAHLQRYLAALRGKAELWWSIGGWQVPDFAHVGTLLATPAGRKTLSGNFRALLAALPVDGFDVDMEESYDEGMRDAIVGFSLLADELGAGVTYCPYTQVDFWLACLSGVFGALDHQVVKRWNLQCYAGGTGNTTQEWLASLQAYSGQLGIPDVRSFLVPGNWVRSDDGAIQNSPADIQAFIAQEAIRKDAAGGFLWCTSEIFASKHSAADHATAIRNGLG